MLFIILGLQFDDGIEINTRVYTKYIETTDWSGQWEFGNNHTIKEVFEVNGEEKVVLVTTQSFEIILRRNMANHWLQTFMPSLMICIISTMSVFVPSSQVPGRLGKCITSFLALISLFNGARYLFLYFNHFKATLSNKLYFRILKG